MASENENNFTPGITGNISDPQVTTPSDPANITPFYGETQLQDNVINFPVTGVPNMPVGNVAPMVGSPGNNIVAPPTKDAINDYISGTLADFDSTEGKNNYAKIYSYDSGPASNAFYDRYAAFGEEKLREVGFSPIRDNEALYNANTTWWDNTSRMLSNSFLPLAGLGFKTGVKSLGKMLQGDFTSADLDEAKEYEYYSAIGQDSRGGAGAFFNNTFMNFGYTAGIMAEAALEEVALTAATYASGGLLGGVQAARKGSLLNRLGKVGKMGTIGKGFKNTLQSLGNVNKARSFWKNRNVKAALDFANPFENTVDAIKGINKASKQGQKLTKLAQGFKTAGGFYRDVRNINMAFAEARLESGMVINSTYDEGYKDFYKKTGRAPNNEEQRFIRAVAEKKGLETLLTNAGLIYISNKITFSNITRPRGGISKFMRNTREEIYDIAASGGQKKFGTYGKILYDNTQKAFIFEKNNLKNLAKSWWKNPGFKTAKETVVYFKGNFMEGLQENAQEAIARANEESAKRALDSAMVQRSTYSNGVIDWTLKDQAGIEGTSWSEYQTELGKEFSARGFETFASGFFMGMFAKPINAAVPFLGVQYNRMFNKAEYAKWVETKKFVSESLVEQLNNVDLNTFLDSRIINLGTQSNIANAKASQGASTKENFDTDNESFISAVDLMNRTNSTNLFVDKLKSMQELTDKELLGAIEGDTKKKPEYYRERIQKSINKIEAIDQRYKEAQEMFPNPVPSLEGLDKTDTYEYNAQVALHHAWNKSVENFVFFNESFADVTERMSDIQDSYMQNSNIGESDYGAARVLFDPMQINQQQTILDQEIDTEQQKNNPDRNRINALKEQKKSLENYKKAFSEFRKFYIRDDFRPQARQILQAQKGEEEVTDQEVDDYINSELGPLDDQQKQAEIIRNLKNSHHSYLRAVAKGVNTNVLDSALDDGFEKLTDYYKLGQESREMSRMINILHDPAGFLEVVDKNQKWMKRLYDRRSEYYTRLVNSQVSMVEDNAFLNQLADQGLYMSADDFAQFVKDGTLPSEIFNNIDKVVYKKGTPEYEQIYREFFIPYENLKNLTVKEAALANDDIYKAKVADINKMYDDKIASLPLEDTKVTLAEFPAKKGQTYKLNDLVKDLEGGQYIQATYDENQDPVIFYKDKEGNLRFVDESGEIVDVKKLNKEFNYLSAEIYNIQSLPNQNTVNLINQQRNEELERITQEYLENEDSAEVTTTPTEKAVVYTTDSDIASMPAELRNALFVEFDKTLTLEQRDTLTEEQQENLFDKFVKQGNFTVKKIIDDYNQKQEAKAAVKGEGLKKDFEFKFNGKTISTIGKNAPTLRAIQTRIKLQVESLEEKKTRTPQEDENIKYLKIQIKNLEGVINSRIRSGFSPEQQAAIDKIQELKSKQPKYRQENDGYYIEGKGKDPYSRVTSVINQFLGDYTYKDKEKVQEIFDRTLGQDITAIDAFIDEINKAGISGVEPYTLRELKVRLPKVLEGVSEMVAMEQAAIGLSDLVPELEGAEELTNKEDIATLEKVVLIDETIEEGQPGYDGSISVGIELTKLEERDQSLIEGTEAYKAAQELVKSDPKRYRLAGKGSIYKYKTSATYRITVKDKPYKVNVYRFEDGKVLYSLNLLDKQGLPVEKVKAQDIFDTASATSLKDAAVNLVGELTYESSRITGNYVDKAVKDLFDKGTVPEFNENQISREAYDNLFGPEGMLTELKRRVDNGELYIASTGIVVYDDALRIAGEIDLLVADRKGNITIVDIKTGQSSKWNGFFKKGNKFSKLQNYGLQQTAYANLLNRMIGVDANIALLPIQITKSTSENTDGKIESAQRPSSANLLSSEYLINLNKADFAERINSVIPLTTAPSTDSSLENKLGETESSDEQDNDALEDALKQPIKNVKMTKSEVKAFNELKSQIAKAKSIKDIDTVNRNIMIAELQGEIPTEAVSELNSILEAAKAALNTGSNFGAPSITLANVKVGSEVIAKLDVIKTKGKSKGDIFVEKDGIVKVSKIDGNKITVKSNDGSVMTLTLDQINDNYLSNDALNDPKSFEQNVTKEEENFGKETTTATSELLANDAKLKEINDSNISAEDAEDNLLDDLDC